MSTEAEKPKDAVEVVATPKLQKVDSLLVSQSDHEFIKEKTNAAYMRGAIASAVTIPLTGFLLMRRFPLPMNCVASLSVGLFAGLGGVVSAIPSAVREGLLFLPNSSPLKMSLFHTVQQMNPELSPQQIYTMIHRHEAKRGHKLPSAQ